jgi:hypothetical protein
LHDYQAGDVGGEAVSTRVTMASSVCPLW